MLSECFGVIALTVRSIVTYPDPRLLKAALRVDVFDDDLRALAQDLFDTMQAASGVGITAPHIGVLTRMVVLALPGEAIDAVRSGAESVDKDAAGASITSASAQALSSYQVYINPEITDTSAETVQCEEGSISMPGVIEKIVRAARVTVRYVDINGTPQTEEAHGFRAVCHQHEIDQLNGVFWTDKLSRLKRERIVTRFTKLQRGS